MTRSGTNTYHGSAFEFIRNNFIDATNFFASTKDQLHQNQYGGTFGGKILRDRLFAFAAYQHLNSKQLSSSTQATVPHGARTCRVTSRSAIRHPAQQPMPVTPSWCSWSIL